MDYYMDKEWAGSLHLKSYSQWLRVQMETRDKCCPCRVYVGTSVINIHVSHIDSGIGCTLSQFADDTQLSGAFDPLREEMATRGLRQA